MNKLDQGNRLLLKMFLATTGACFVWVCGIGCGRLFSNLPTAPVWLIFLIGIVGLIEICWMMVIGE
jgi:hypothetical protein